MKWRSYVFVTARVYEVKAILNEELIAVSHHQGSH